MDSSTMTGPHYELWLDEPLCGDCPMEEEWPEPWFTVDDARLLLYQRCLDAGWSRAKASKYINRHLPQ